MEFYVRRICSENKKGIFTTLSHDEIQKIYGPAIFLKIMLWN